MLDIEGITKTYRGQAGAVTALEDVSLTVAAGEFVGVQGPSGCGKSTLLLAAGGLLACEAGAVRIAGTDPYELPPNDRAAFRAREVGFVFQRFHLVPYLSVRDNVLAASLACPAPDARERAEELIAHFGLADRIDHTPAELSTGERQRTALARALLNRPRLLLADEPTGNLDAASADAVMGVLKKFASDGGAVLLVTHDPRAADVAGRTVHLHAGRIQEQPAASPGA